jgi:hypothetical protein
VLAPSAAAVAFALSSSASAAFAVSYASVLSPSSLQRGREGQTGFNNGGRFSSPPYLLAISGPLDSKHLLWIEYRLPKQ